MLTKQDALSEYVRQLIDEFGVEEALKTYDGFIEAAIELGLDSVASDSIGIHERNP